MSYNLRLIVGLGNPGPKYKNTRHNAGFLAIDELAEKLNATKFKLEKKFQAEITNAEYNGQKIILRKPQTYMNNSGIAVLAILNFYKLLPKKLGLIKTKGADLSEILTVIHDDIDFNLGEFKTQKNRSSGGHNGIKSIIKHLKTQNFTRVRIGINRATHNAQRATPTEKFVLEKFSSEEMEKLEKVMPNIIEELLAKIK